MIVFVDGWNTGTNNNAPKALGKDDLEAAIKAAAAELKNRTTDEELLYFKTVVESTSSMLKAKVVMGMHQDTGNSIVPETHATIEVSYWVSASSSMRRYHLWFVYVKTGWRGWRLSYEYAPKQYKSVDL